MQIQISTFLKSLIHIIFLNSLIKTSLDPFLSEKNIFQQSKFTGIYDGAVCSIAWEF